jgi:hypothetical protein
VFAKILNLIRNEPALLTSTAQAVLGIIVAFGIGLTADQTGAILAVWAAALAAVTAAYARPVGVSAFTGLVTAAAVLIASFGFHVSADVVGSVNFLITAVCALLARGQLTTLVTLRKRQVAAATIGNPPVPSGM